MTPRVTFWVDDTSRLRRRRWWGVEAEVRVLSSRGDGRVKYEGAMF